MKVTVVSTQKNVCQEFEEKLNISLNCVAKDNAQINKDNSEIAFFPDVAVPFELIKSTVDNGVLVVFNAVACTIESLRDHGIDASQVIGMNLLPTFVNRPLAEITLSQTNKSDTSKLIELGWEIKEVESRIGLVTPRVIFMIINEAYYTVQEGTASREDIDIGMKLGTNYPKGPFEWSKAIGVQNIYRTLDALFEDTKEGRYKICPLLKREVLG